jgi:hypothetical protein
VVTGNCSIASSIVIPSSRFSRLHPSEPCADVDDLEAAKAFFIDLGLNTSAARGIIVGVAEPLGQGCLIDA